MGIELNVDDRLLTRSLDDFAKLLRGYWDLLSVAEREVLEVEWAVFVRQARRLAEPKVEGRFAWPRPTWEDWQRRMLSLYGSVPDSAQKSLILDVAGWDKLWIQFANCGVDEDFPEIVQVVIEPGGRLPDPSIVQALSWKPPVDDVDESHAGWTFWVPKYVYAVPGPNFTHVAQFLAIVLEVEPAQLSLREFGGFADGPSYI